MKLQLKPVCYFWRDNGCRGEMRQLRMSFVPIDQMAIEITRMSNKTALMFIETDSLDGCKQMVDPLRYIEHIPQGEVITHNYIVFLTTEQHEVSAL